MTGPCNHCGKQTDRWGLWDGFDEATGKATSGTFFDCGCTDPIPTHFGKELRAWRLEHNLSLRDVAAKMGATPVIISHFETGREVCTPDMARAFAAALGANTEAWVRFANEGHIR